MKISSVKVYDLEESIIASGFPMDTGYLRNNFEVEVYALRAYIAAKMRLTHKEYLKEEAIKRCENHLGRAIRLAHAKSGSGHDSGLKGIIVNYNIDYTQYWSMQCQRYHHIDFVSSSSKMYKLLDSDLSKLEFLCDISKITADVLRDKIKKYKENINKDMSEEDKREMFLDVVRHVPAGFKQHARMTTNYLQLKTIYFQRKSHKTTDWREYCKWIETLPLFKELIINDRVK